MGVDVSVMEPMTALVPIVRMFASTGDTSRPMISSLKVSIEPSTEATTTILVVKLLGVSTL